MINKIPYAQYDGELKSNKIVRKKMNRKQKIKNKEPLPLQQIDLIDFETLFSILVSYV